MKMLRIERKQLKPILVFEGFSVLHFYKLRNPSFAGGNQNGQAFEGSSYI